MSLQDPYVKQIAINAVLRYKVCMKCNARNPLSAKQCRRCRSRKLRMKKMKMRGKK